MSQLKNPQVLKINGEIIPLSSCKPISFTPCSEVTGILSKMLKEKVIITSITINDIPITNDIIYVSFLFSNRTAFSIYFGHQEYDKVSYREIEDFIYNQHPAIKAGLLYASEKVFHRYVLKLDDIVEDLKKTNYSQYKQSVKRVDMLNQEYWAE